MRSDLQKYKVVSSKEIPARFRIRDIIFTTIAWGIWIYICWDVLVMMEVGLLKGLNLNPENDMNWELFFKQLEMSYTFSGTIIVFLFFWAIANTIVLSRMIKRQEKYTSPLSLEEQARAYNCLADEVRIWRETRLLTVSVDDFGNVLSVK